MKDKVIAFLKTVWADIVDTYKRFKLVFIAVGGIILALEFQKIKTFILVYMGQKEIDSANKQDQILSSKESTANQQADALVKEANELPSKQAQVNEDWYKGTKK